MLAALSLLATLPPDPTGAQGVGRSAIDGTQVLANTARGFSNPVTGLNAPLLPDTNVKEVTRDLTIEAREWPGTAILGVGRGCYAPMANPKSVSFYNMKGTYTPGMPIARACPYRGAAPCSRSVTVDLAEFPILGLSGTRMFTANRRATTCPPNPQQDMNNVPTGTPRTATGMFTVRVYGKIRLPGFSVVHSLETPAPPSDPDTWNWNSWGYQATFMPGENCGPARWPTPELRDADLPPFAEWCDFTVVVVP